MIDYRKALDEGTPPTTDEVCDKREQARQEEKRIEQKRRKWLRKTATVLAIVAGLLLVTAVLIQWPPEWWNSERATIVMGTPQSIGIPIIYVVLITGLLFTYHYDRAIGTPLEITRGMLISLKELNAENMPHECVELDEWRKEFPEIEEYLKQVAMLGRTPVLGEYVAAREWLEEARKRKRVAEMKARARAACERFGRTP